MNEIQVIVISNNLSYILKFIFLLRGRRKYYPLTNPSLFDRVRGNKIIFKAGPKYNVVIRATEIFKSKSVHSTDDVIGTCVRQSQIVMKTNDSSFSSKSVSEIDYLSNTL